MADVSVRVQTKTTTERPQTYSSIIQVTREDLSDLYFLQVFDLIDYVERPRKSEILDTLANIPPPNRTVLVTCVASTPRHIRVFWVLE